MSLLLRHKLAGGFCSAISSRKLIHITAHAWVMSKRPASPLVPSDPAHTELCASNGPFSASPSRPMSAAAPPSKRRRLQAASAGHPAAQTATASPKAAAQGAKAPAAKPATPKVDENGMWMIVGLGNPGANYDNTRHNIGFAVVDELARQADIDCRKLEKSAAVGRGELHGKQVLLVKPVTFMNNSGESVAALARFYRVPPGRVLVVADDLDMPVAQVRLRIKGGHGGHNGLRSIIDRLGGTQDFPRIKVGIGRPTGPVPVASYVLQPFSKAERPEVDVAVQESITLIKSVLALGLERAVSGVRI